MFLRRVGSFQTYIRMKYFIKSWKWEFTTKLVLISPINCQIAKRRLYSAANVRHMIYCHNTSQVSSDILPLSSTIISETRAKKISEHSRPHRDKYHRRGNY